MKSSLELETVNKSSGMLLKWSVRPRVGVFYLVRLTVWAAARWRALCTRACLHCNSQRGAVADAAGGTARRDANIRPSTACLAAARVRRRFDGHGSPHTYPASGQPARRGLPRRRIDSAARMKDRGGATSTERRPSQSLSKYSKRQPPPDPTCFITRGRQETAND